MRKNWDDVNWLPTLKKHSQFEIFGILKILKIKNILNKFFNISKVLYHM
jgi:hypothetical protein